MSASDKDPEIAQPPGDLDAYLHMLEIRCLHAVQELLAGEYLSVFKGRGIEFDEVRPYTPGDEVRTIDWNVTARTGEPYVKRFIEERDLTVYLLVDVSGSGEFGSVTQTKRQAAAELAGLLAFSAAENHDRVGGMIFTDTVERFYRPAKGRLQVMRMLHDMLKHEPQSRGTRIAEPLEMLMHVAGRRAVVFVISDFMDQGWEDTLQAAAGQHDIVVVSVIDRHEAKLPKVGLLKVRDAETGATRVIDTDEHDVREAFGRSVVEHHQRLAQTFDEAGVDHFQLWVGDDYVGALHEFLRSRMSSRRRNHHG